MKKLTQKLVLICISLILFISAFSHITSADISSTVTIRGYVYIDNQITEPDQVILEISGEEYPANTIYSDGYYIINAEVDMEQERTFKVTYGQTWQAEELDFYVEDDAYKINLSINTSEDPISDDDLTPPSKVENLVVSDKKDGKLDLTWDTATDNEEISHYNIYREGTLINTETSTAYSDTGLTNNQEYCYQVSAVDTSNNEGELSNEECATPTESNQNSGPSGPSGPTGPTNPPDDDGDDTTTDGEDDENDEDNPPIIPDNPPVMIEFTQTNIDGFIVNFSALAKDPDGDRIKYIFNWSDETEETEYVDNNTRYNISHDFQKSGKYTVKAWAEDEYYNKTSENILDLNVYINSIPVDDIDGYLTDDDSDETYDNFHSNEGSVNTNLGSDNESYFIDTDDDSEYDYKYNKETGELSDYEEKNDDEDPDDNQDKDTDDSDNTIWYLLGAFLIIVFIVLFFFATRKKDKKK